MSVLLDTHIWLRWLLQNPALTAKEETALGQAAENRQTYISAISMWEAQMLYAKGRLTLDVEFERWLRQAAEASVVQVLPLAVEVVAAVNGLPSSFHGDPADRIIVATARAFDLPLATYDKNIRRARLARLWKPS